ncbi:hypothetical protein ACWDPV_02275 [Gordonia sp. NPDC003504]
MNVVLRSSPLLRALAVSLLVVAMAAAPAVGVAAAAPGDPPPPLSLDSLGSSSAITFPGQQGQVSMSIPVPQDLTPDVLRGVTSVPPFVTGGEVDVYQGERLISRTPVDPAPNSPITLPLRGLTVDGNAAEITLRSYLRVDGLCRFDPDNAFRISGATVTFTGREAIPTTVAQFLPPILRDLAIIIPDDVQQAEGAAAVNLAAAVTAHYGTAQVGITTVVRPRSDLAPSDAPGPLERQIVVDSSAPTGLTLRDGPEGSKYLVVGGAGDALVTQSEFLTTDLDAIALSSSAVAGPLYDAPQLTPDVQTLADLGVSDQRVTSSSWPSLTFGVDQTRLGRPSTNIRVQLMGTYAPAGGDSAVISVRIGDRVIATLPTDSSGTYNSWVDIPNDLAARYTEVTVTLERSGLLEGCGNGTRANLTLSSTGQITSDVADPPQPSGLGSVPQSLMPWTQMAWTTGDAADVSRGVEIAAGLQRISVVPLGLRVVSVSEALSSELPAILISAEGKDIPDIDLPVSADGGEVTVRSSSGSTSSVTLDPALRYGVLQATRAGDRTVLVAGSTGDARDLDDLLDWLADDNRWTSVSGDAIAIVKVRDQQPLYIDADKAAPAPPAEAASIQKTIGLVLAVVAVALILGGAVILVEIARRRRATRHDPGAGPSEDVAPEPDTAEGGAPDSGTPDADR